MAANGTGLSGRPARPPPVWNVPHDRHTNFVGRGILLDALAPAGGRTPTGAARAITGPGGVGKTQLAVEYAYAHRDDFDVVWWVRAEEAATLRGDLASLGQVLGLTAAGQADLDLAAGEVRAWLEGHDRWMVVADNAEDVDLLESVLPETGVGGGQVLVTSRRTDWSGTAEVVDVDVLDVDSAVDYLLRRTGETRRPPALALARALGCLPLALAETAAYVADTPGLDLAGYLELFTSRAAALPDGGGRATGPAAVAVTCGLAVERLEKVSPVAATVLRACAFLAPETIPVSLLSGVDELPEPMAAGPKDLGEALAALARLGLVRSTWPGGIAVDRVVQAAVRENLAGDGRRTWAAGVVRLVERAFPADSTDVSAWVRCRRLVPHALAASAHDEAAELEPQATSRLLARTGIYLQGRGQLDEAQGLLERSLAIVEVAYGPECPEAATHLGNLALVHRDTGDLGDARVCLERAVAIVEQAYGPQHPSVGTLTGSLAQVFADLGDPARARLCFERALGVEETVYGSDHPVVAGHLSGLGFVLWNDGDLVEARRCFEEALTIDEAALGPDAPSVARDHANLALVLADQGQLDDAHHRLEQAVAIVESAFGPDHPEVGSHLSNLAVVLQDRGRLVEARGCLERALVIARDSLGPTHPTTAGVLNNLGAVLSDLGDPVGARECFDSALAIDEAALGPDHPEVIGIRENQAMLLRKFGRDS